MTFNRWVILWFGILIIQAFAVTTNINVQIQISDTKLGNYEGFHDITFALFTATANYDTLDKFKFNSLWWENHTNYLIQNGLINQKLGLKREINYHHFKNENLYLGVYFHMINDIIFIPMISVPSAIYAHHSGTAKEIEFTSHWLKIDTVNQRIGIGTLSPEYEFHIIGTLNADVIDAGTFVTNTDNIQNFDYNQIDNLDDFSLHAFDYFNFETQKDVVFVGDDENVGIGIENTNNIQEKLHISGNVLIENGDYLGKNSNIVLTGNIDSANTPDTPTINGKTQLIWNSKKAAFRAGKTSGDKWAQSNLGYYSAAFGEDTKVKGNYAFAAGQSNEVLASHSVILGGKNNQIDADFSGILGGDENKIPTSNSTYSVIGGGNKNIINSSGSSNAILGGADNKIIGKSAFSSILGGDTNLINGKYSLSFGQHSRIEHDHTVLFGDDTCTAGTLCESSTSNQFVIYSKNGLGIGTNQIRVGDPTTANTFPVDTFVYTDEGVATHSIRTVGDIIAMDNNNKLRFIIADGRYLKNVNTPWRHDQLESQIYVTGDYKVGIGTATPDVNLHIKQEENTPTPPILRIEDGDQKIDITISSNIAEIKFQNGMAIRHADLVTESILITTESITIYPKLLMNSPNVTVMQITGNAFFEGFVSADRIIAITVNAEYFFGDGSHLTNVPGSHYLNAFDDNVLDLIPPIREQVFVSSNGYVGIGVVTSDIKQLLHIGTTTNVPQIRLERQTTGGNPENYTTLKASTNVFEINIVHNQTPINNPIFTLVSSRNGEAGPGEEFIIVRKGGSMEFGDKTPADDNGDPTPIILPNNPAVALGNAIPFPLITFYGTISANAFIGNGVSVNSVQLDTDQINDVTFNKTVTASTMNVRFHIEADTVEVTNYITSNAILSGANHFIVSESPGAPKMSQSGIIGGSSSAIKIGNNNFIGGGSFNEITGAIQSGDQDRSNNIILGSNHFMFDTRNSTAIGFNTRINTPHENTFIYGDGNCSNSDNNNSANCRSSASNQFLIFAQNGVIIGTNQFTNDPSNGGLFDENIDTYIGTSATDAGPDIPDYSLRVIGDIIAQRDTGELGYIIGDGRFLKNVEIADVQIKVDQVNEVTFNNNITINGEAIINSMVQFIPEATCHACNLANRGLLFARVQNGLTHLFFCHVTNGGEAISLVDRSTTCQ